MNPIKDQSPASEKLRRDLLASNLLEALKSIVEFCDDPAWSERQFRESLAMGLARLLPAARKAIARAEAAMGQSANERDGGK
jgi:hypothetical protein